MRRMAPPLSSGCAIRRLLVGIQTTARFEFLPRQPDPAVTVYVDGTEAGFRSLSHWPGNTTPAELKHDLSTGIALDFAGRPALEQRRLVGPVEVFAQNHFDTDGVLSAFAVMHPDRALPRADAMLRAAATGDFATWHGPDALAVELTVMSITKHRASPLAAQIPAGTDQETRWARGYDWLLERMDAVLDDPWAWRALWEPRHELISRQVENIDAGRGPPVERFPDEDLAVVTSAEPLTAIALHHAAGPAYRVLLIQPGSDGYRYRFAYRDESWFDTVSFTPLARRPLEPVAAALEALEGPGPREGVWWHTALAAPVALLGFGDAGLVGNAFFEDPDLREQPPSRLAPRELVPALRELLAD